MIKSNYKLDTRHALVDTDIINDKHVCNRLGNDSWSSMQ